MGQVINPFSLLLIAILLAFLEYFFRFYFFGILGCLFLVLCFIDFILVGFSLYQILTWGLFLGVLFYIILKLMLRGTKAESDAYHELINREGVVVIALEPLGRVWVNGTEMKAISEDGHFIERGKIVRVVSITPNNRAIVKVV